MDLLAQQLCDHSLDPKTGLDVKIAPHANEIPCLLFTDDSLLFCKASSQSAFKLKNFLDTFCLQLGQMINFHKLSIVLSKNTFNLDRQHVIGVFNIMQSSSLGKYLGCSVF